MPRSQGRRSPSLRSTISARALRLRHNAESLRSYRLRRSPSNAGPVRSPVHNTPFSTEPTPARSSSSTPRSSDPTNIPPNVSPSPSPPPPVQYTQRPPPFSADVCILKSLLLMIQYPIQRPVQPLPLARQPLIVNRDYLLDISDCDIICPDCNARY